MAANDPAALSSAAAEAVASGRPRLLDRVRATLRMRHYSRETEKTYVGLIRRFIMFHGKRHPRELGAAEVTRYLSTLATAGHVAASTQNQALSALLFLYRDCLSEGFDSPRVRELSVTSGLSLLPTKSPPVLACKRRYGSRTRLFPQTIS